MSVRLATTADIDALLRMAKHFINYGPHGAMIDISDDELRAQIAALLAYPNVAGFVAELDGQVVGMIVGVLNTPWFAPNLPMATELAWWVEPEVRGTTVALRLVKMYEGWAASNGARFLTMSALEMDNENVVGGMLQRIGYAKAETTYIKGER